MRVALCQLTSGPEPDGNLATVAEWTARAAAEGARLVVFPEATMARFGTPLGELAESIDGPWAQEVARIAERAGVVLVAGMFTPGEGGRVRNTLLATGGGRHVGYDKIHLYDAFGFQESRTVQGGDGPVLIEVDDIAVGLATCYDVRFPELFRAHADAGADAVVLPASWGAGPGKQQQWELLVRARALDSGSWVLACGQADPAATGVSVRSAAPTGIGHSLIADPFGRVQVAADAEPRLLVAEIDPAMAAESRAATAVLDNRRPDVLG